MCHLRAQMGANCATAPTSPHDPTTTITSLRLTRTLARHCSPALASVTKHGPTMLPILLHFRKFGNSPQIPT